MKEKLLLGPKYVLPKEYKDREVFFLAGPIRGGGDWQMEAAEILWEKFPGCVVADPTRWDKNMEDAKTNEEREKVKQHIENLIGAKDGKLYPMQPAWEEEYMKMASEKGTLFFWFEKESKEKPRTDGIYARDTRVEIGMWIEKIKNNPELKVKIGGKWEIDENKDETENSFGGLNFIIYYLTGETDRRKIYDGQIKNEHLILSSSLREFFDKFENDEKDRELKLPKIR